MTMITWSAKWAVVVVNCTRRILFSIIMRLSASVCMRSNSLIMSSGEFLASIILIYHLLMCVSSSQTLDMIRIWTQVDWPRASTARPTNNSHCPWWLYSSELYTRLQRGWSHCGVLGSTLSQTEANWIANQWSNKMDQEQTCQVKRVAYFDGNLVKTREKREGNAVNYTRIIILLVFWFTNSIEWELPTSWLTQGWNGSMVQKHVYFFSFSARKASLFFLASAAAAASCSNRLRRSAFLFSTVACWSLSTSFQIPSWSSSGIDS